MKISARAALQHDKYPIYHLYEQAMKNHIEAIWGWEQSWQDKNFEEAFQVAQTYIIEGPSVMLGYFQVAIKEVHDYLSMLILKPEDQSRGYGAKVLSNILKIAHDHGKILLLRVFKINHHAKRFYEREGWRVEAGEDAFFLLGHPLNAYIEQSSYSSRGTTGRYAFEDHKT